MRTRRYFWTGSAIAGCLLSAGLVITALNAQAQDRPSSDVKFYQGKVSPGSAPPPAYVPRSNAPVNGPSAPLPSNGPAPLLRYPNANDTFPQSSTGRVSNPAQPQPQPRFNTGKPTAEQDQFPATPGTGLNQYPSPVIPVSGSTPAAEPQRPAYERAGPSAPLPPANSPNRPFPPSPGTGTPGYPTPSLPSGGPRVDVEPEVRGNLPEPKPLNSRTPNVEAMPAFDKPANNLPSNIQRAVFSDPNAASTTNGMAPLPARQAPAVTVDAVAPESVGVGQNLVYELVVRNIGTSPVYNVRVEDELPARCQFLGSEPKTESSTDRLSWTIGTLEAAGEKRIKISVKPSEEGEIRSRAMVTFAVAVDARVKVTRPKIGVTMTGPESTRVGERVPFQIKLTNSGSGPANRIQLRAQFTEGLAHPSGNIIEAELKDPIQPGQTKTLTLEATAARPGQQLCQLAATADGGQPENAKVQVNLVEPMLQVKQVGPTRCLVKSEPTYQIELSNPGTAATDPVSLWAAMPQGFELVSASDNGSFLEANRAIGWRLPALPAGSTRTVTLKLRAIAPSEGSLRTIAQANPPEVTQQDVTNVEYRTVSNVKGLEARTETPVKAEGVPALRFEVSDVEDPVEVGKEAIYEIRVVNQGTGPCTNVQIVADLAEGSHIIGTTNGPTAGRPNGQQIFFDPIPSFGVKAEAVYRIRVRGNVPGDHRFRVRLVCDQVRTPVVKEENTRFYKE
jgi:uncharacterized repeat protein (TIGR01451 family)